MNTHVLPPHSFRAGKTTFSPSLFVRYSNCERADEEPFRNEEEEEAQRRRRGCRREHVTVDGAMRKRESVRDQVENGDSKSRKGVSHLHGFTGCHNPARSVFVSPRREVYNTMRGRDTGSQRTTKLFLDDGNVDAFSNHVSANRTKTSPRRK